MSTLNRVRKAGPALALVLAMVGCGSDGGDHWVAPGDRGSYSAGTLLDWVDASRGDSLDLQVWYPVAEGVEQPFHYEVFAATEGQAVEEGPGACDSPRPVVMFSHGNGGINYQTYSLSEHLARHGYVVAAPNHVRNTAFDMEDDLRRAMCLWRPGDISESYDYLVSLSEDPESPLFGCVDPAAGYAVMGHSFGGWTTLAVAGARLDMRVLDAECQGSTKVECDIILMMGWEGDGCGAGFRPVEDVLTTLQSLVTAFLETARGDPRAAELLPPGEGILSFESDAPVEWNVGITSGFRLSQRRS